MSGNQTVGLVDDHPLVLRGLRHLLSGSRFRVEWDAADRDQCVGLSSTRRVDVIVLDLRLGTDLAPDLIRELRQIGVDSHVVVLTGYTDALLLNACIEAKASGILLKDTTDHELVTNLNRVLQGEVVMDPRLESLVSDQPPALLVADLPFDLRPRELDSLRLVASGLTSRQAAAELCLSVNTVRSYVQSALLKLGAHTRIEAISIARRRGLL